MAYVINDPGWGEGMSALAKALFPDPEKQLKAAYYGANARQANAHADKYTAETADLQRYAQSQQRLQDLIRNKATVAEMLAAGVGTDAQTAKNLLPFITGAVTAHGDVPGGSTLAANTGVQQYGQTVTGFREGQATEVQKQNIASGAALAGTRYSADKRAATDLTIAREAPIMLNKDQTAVLSPGVAKARGLAETLTGQVSVQPAETVHTADGRTYQGVPTKSSAQGEIITRGAAPGAVPFTANELAALGADGSGDGRLAAILRPGDSDKLAARLNQAVQATYGMGLDPKYLETLRPALAEAFQQTRNTDAAVATVLSLLGKEPQKAGIGNPFSTDRITGPGAAAPVPAPVPPPVPAASAAPATDPHAAIIAEARAAIAKGAPRDKVVARLRENNIPIPPDL